MQNTRPPLLTLTVTLWRTSHKTKEAIVIKWDANNWRGILSSFSFIENYGLMWLTCLVVNVPPSSNYKSSEAPIKRDLFDSWLGSSLLNFLACNPAKWLVLVKLIKFKKIVSDFFFFSGRWALLVAGQRKKEWTLQCMMGFPALTQKRLFISKPGKYSCETAEVYRKHLASFTVILLVWICLLDKKRFRIEWSFYGCNLSAIAWSNNEKYVFKQASVAYCKCCSAKPTPSIEDSLCEWALEKIQ